MLWTGYILHYFPRHVILGMTFGFGIFLLCTCFQVTTGFTADIHIFSTIFQLDSNSLIQLGLVTVVEIVLRVIAHYRIGGEMAGPLVMYVLI
jgi:MFS superfamily sulfate permease-like transporter